jgi:arsenite-transporting ATPase
MTEFIMFGGKGGVGKTTCASATALSLAEDGFKTLVVSTDPAHSIADVYDVEIGSEPEQVFENVPLYAREVDPEKRFNENYSDVADAVLNEASKLGVDVDVSEFSDLDGGVIGSDEAAVIDLFAEYDSNDDWDYVVFDTAPTGHTLRMLQLPELLDSVVGTALGFKKKYDSVKGKVTGIIPGSGDGNEEDDKKDLDDIDVEETRNRMEKVAEILRDPSRTQFYAVMEAEELSLLETRRLVAQLNSYEIPVGGVFINKVLTDVNEDCDLCTSRRENQQEVINKANNNLDLPLLELPLQEDPPRGDDLYPIANKISVS